MTQTLTHKQSSQQEETSMLPIEEVVNREITNISDGLLEMAKYRSWSESTLQSYRNDVRKFEEFLMTQNLDPILKNGEGLHIVTKWIREQKDNKATSKTICRRIASLSSIYSFYKPLNIVKMNAFQVAQVPVSQTGSHSYVMDFSEMKQVYIAIQDLLKEGIDVEVPIKLLLFTGLRNESFSKLLVKNVDWEESVLIYDAGIENSKHKVQVWPIPPKLLATLRNFVDTNGLGPEDPLCYGLKGMPIKNKQLNRITDAVCDKLGWTKEKKVTPHGFRYSISTLLDERGLSREHIKYLLGHSEKENVQHYIKRDKRRIFQLKKELTKIEEELENSLAAHQKDLPTENGNKTAETPTEVPSSVNDKHEGTAAADGFVITEDFLLKLADTNPEVS